MPDSAAVFASVFVALYAAHSVGDHWVQSSCQAGTKGRPGWQGRLACARHVAGLAATKAVALAAAAWVLHLPLTWLGLLLGLGVDTVSHYWADRRSTLAALARLAGKGEFYALGSKVTDDQGHPTHLGTGAYALDQSWHIGWLFVAALLIAAL